MTPLPRLRLGTITSLLALMGCLWTTPSFSAETPKRARITHAPVQPRSGQGVTIRIAKELAATTTNPTLQYQIVEPGKYIEKDAAAFQRGWKSIAPNPDPAQPEVLRFEVPGEIQVHRRLIRYRVTDGPAGKVVIPTAEDSCPNLAYFVYDGIPSWKASVKPGGSKSEFSSELLSSVQAYHLIATQKAIEDSQWKEPLQGDEDARHAYRWTGTLVGADGTVYDHIRYRPRGGSWRHAMGKNMWKLDFNKGHKFRVQDNWGKDYPSRWSKLNLGACIQQGDYGMRGEQGLFESVGFQMFNLAGLPAPKTHFVQLRVITGSDEQGSNQYGGDFWGLYLAVENIDDDFIKDHDLPDQSLFKVDGMRPHWGKQGADKLTEADAGRFVNGLFSNPSIEWWKKNVDLDLYYNYRAILECIHHYDVDAGKNYFFRRDPDSKRWAVVPWDIDLTWGERMYGMGQEPFHPVLRIPQVRQAYQNRLREIRDLLFNPEQTGALIDEYAALISTPHNGQTFVEADRRKWDFNPIMSSSYVMHGSKTEPGLFYSSAPGNDFAGMVRLMKGYVANRIRTLDARWLKNPALPPIPALGPASNTHLSKGPLTFSVQNASETHGTLEWRLGEITPAGPATLAKDRVPHRYEITTLWSTNGPSSIQIPAKLFESGHTYRVRARWLNESGVAGHFSPPAEFVALP